MDNISNIEEARNGNLVSSQRSNIASFKVMDVLKRANELESQGRKILHCEVGQPESGAPSSVAAEAARALIERRQVMGYTEAFGLPELREKIAQHYALAYRRGGRDNDNENGDEKELLLTVAVKPSNIVVTTGSSAGFLLAFLAALDVSDVVGVASSGYPCYRNILSALGCEVATIAINQHFKLTATELSEEIRRRSAQNLPPLRGLILSSPSNPTGAMLTEEELRAICETCDAHGIQFISDEIYHGISYGTTKEATAIMYSKNSIVINSFSKYYSMSGWRLGWLIIPDHLVDPINRLQQNMFINAPTISQTAALQCWEKETIQELEGHVEKYRRSREVILKTLASIREMDPANIAPADGGFYVYVDLGEENVARHQGTNDSTTSPPHYILGSVEFCQALLEEEGVALTPGTDFEDPQSNLGNRRFRISYAGGEETVREAMKKLYHFWPTWLQRVRQLQE
jgi:aspartate/methionine/tyrosine aminotransferase